MELFILYFSTCMMYVLSSLQHAACSVFLWLRHPYLLFHQKCWPASSSSLWCPTHQTIGNQRSLSIGGHNLIFKICHKSRKAGERKIDQSIGALVAKMRHASKGELEESRSPQYRRNFETNIVSYHLPITCKKLTVTLK